VIAVHDDDLIADDEIHVTTPFGVDSMSGAGTSTTRTLVSTTVPTVIAKFTLLARGTLPPTKTVCLILVR
jgi:hypothetical protein